MYFHWCRMCPIIYRESNEIIYWHNLIKYNPNTFINGLFVKHVSIVFSLEPLNGVFLGALVVVSNLGLGSLSSGDSVSSSSHDDVKVHTVNTDSWVVLDSQVDVLVNTESKVTGGREVSLTELVFLDLKTTLDDFFSLWSSDGDVYGNLFVSSDTERSDGISSLGLNWGLTRQLLKHLGSSGQSVSRLTGTDVENELLNL